MSMTTTALRKLRRASYVAALLVPGAGVDGSSVFAQQADARARAAADDRGAQDVARDTAVAIAELDRWLLESADLIEREVWPGYRYDEVGVMFMLPRVAKVAVRPPGEPPTGMQPLPGFEATWWADTGRVSWGGGLPVANVSSGMQRGDVLALALHEGFHAYQAGEARPGRRFGGGDNALVTARYPVFDAQNEALYAVEAALLASAVAADTREEAERRAAQFVAVRARRHARLDSVFVEWERRAELHEGLAQYVYVHGLEVLATRDATLRAAAVRARAQEAAVLETGEGAGALSVRRRFYATGAFLGLLLDRLVGPAWKRSVLEDDAFLDELLAEAVPRATVADETSRRLDAAMASAARAADALATQRDSIRDAILAADGVRLTIRSVNTPDWCFFDPQNVLTTRAGQLLHMRVLRLCVDGAVVADFQRAVIEDGFTRTWHVVADSSLAISAAGHAIPVPRPGDAVQLSDFELTATGLAVHARRALLVGTGSGLVVQILEPPAP